ncbi:hypothetical protein EDB80DRAFT_654461 [Ilyonectria destructans]|nr:hypothetical protein EDB80DRAFT_654461 [Ilyonectria destructans]
MLASCTSSCELITCVCISLTEVKNSITALNEYDVHPVTVTSSDIYFASKTMGEMRSSVKNVALAGATGMLGSHILAAFCQNERYNLTALVRDKSSMPFFPAQVMVIQVDYESHESLVSALQGQDVLVSVLGKSALHCQGRLVDAAIVANVQRFIPAEFGANLKNPKTRSFPTYASKVCLEDQLMRNCKLSNLSYTLIYTNCLLDWAITSQGALLVDPSQRLVKLYDGGNTTFSMTSMATVGRTVVTVLDHYDETANRAICVHDVAISQIELLGTRVGEQILIPW